ncbi:hypothetical protein ACVW16_001804 [Bradyrhizobium sp. USDA 4474]
MEDPRGLGDLLEPPGVGRRAVAMAETAVVGVSELAATVTAKARVDSVLESIVSSILDLGLEFRLWSVVSRPVFGRRLVRNGFGLI